MKRQFLIALLLAFSLPTTGQAPTKERPPIIDMHLHSLSAQWGGPPTFCANDKWKEFPSIDPGESWQPEQLESCPIPLVGAATDEELLRKTLAALERYNIVYAVTSGSVDYVRKWRAAAPDRLIPALAFQPPEGVTPDSLRELFRSGEIAVLGEIWTQFGGMSPSGEELEPYLALAEEFDIPVAIHMGTGLAGGAYYFAPNFRAALTNPLLLEEALLRHPKLRVYVMHAGYPMIDEMIHLLYSHPQVYVDVAVINWYHPRKDFHRYLRRLVEAGFGKRIMFGSDQVIWPEAIGIAIEAIDSADFLSEKQKRDIFYNNGARFLRLDEKKSPSP